MTNVLAIQLASFLPRLDDKSYISNELSAIIGLHHTLVIVVGNMEEIYS
ncbi:hypothetical protein MIDIC_70027 [Alphaproteobacteria bacterium]